MKVLLTGATGYIGRRLLEVLVERGHHVVCLVRNPRRLQAPAPIASRIDLVEGNLLRPETLEAIPSDVEAAYYLVHSMSQGGGDFSRLESECARNLAARLRETSARQIIYLGGLTNDPTPSAHFRSREQVGETLRAGEIPVTILRASIIIGSGSASFEIIRDLVEKLPVMVAPRWVGSRCQPIAIRDVLFYLMGVLGNPGAFGQTFDIGGPDILTYRQMLEQFARARGLRRLIIPVPVLTPRLSSYWLYFVTAVSFPLARTLVDSMKNEAICRDERIRDLLPRACLSYDQSVAAALSRIEERSVVSSWKDAWISGRLLSDVGGYILVPEHGCLVDEQRVRVTGSVGDALDRIWTIGGDTGWYFANSLWWLRGLIDKLVGGVGLRRGRTSPTELRPGDVLDFWRVLLADRLTRRLLLYAEMKLPGEAWLEFQLVGAPGQETLLQRAVFRPRGVLGRLYWYGLLPVHRLIFRGMAARIAGAAVAPTFSIRHFS